MNSVKNERIQLKTKCHWKIKHSTGKHLLRKYNFSEHHCINKSSLNEAE